MLEKNRSRITKLEKNLFRMDDGIDPHICNNRVLDNLYKAPVYKIKFSLHILTNKQRYVRLMYHLNSITLLHPAFAYDWIHTRLLHTDSRR